MTKIKKTPGKTEQSDPISEEDRALFRDSIGPIKKMNSDQIISRQSQPKPVPVQTQRDAVSVLKQLADSPFEIQEVETGDELYFHRPGVQKQTLRKLRKGHYVIENELDLHGMTTAMAKPALVDFLNHSLATGRRCVRIIHGKGHGSIGKKPVLKNKLNLWLQQKEEVLAFCSARPNDGGTGAVYVLLKNK